MKLNTVSEFETDSMLWIRKLPFRVKSTSPADMLKTAKPGLSFELRTGFRERQPRSLRNGWESVKKGFPPLNPYFNPRWGILKSLVTKLTPPPAALTRSPKRIFSIGLNEPSDISIAVPAMKQPDPPLVIPVPPLVIPVPPLVLPPNPEVKTAICRSIGLKPLIRQLNTRWVEKSEAEPSGVANTSAEQEAPAAREEPHVVERVKILVGNKATEQLVADPVPEF